MFYYRYEDTEKGILCGVILEPVYVRKQSNGILIRCDSPTLAQGVVSPDGSEIYRIWGRGDLGGDYGLIDPITQGEYEEYLTSLEPVLEPDPEDREPVVPEEMEPESILTRAELTEKVHDLEEAMDLLLSGVTEDG